MPNPPWTLFSTSPDVGAARRGSVSLYLLLLLPVLCLAIGLALYSTQLQHTRTGLQQTADAAALAAAQTLVDDRLLTADPAVIRGLIQEAAEEGRRYAEENPVLGESLTLRANSDNHEDGDLVFGALRSPTSRDLLVADLNGESADWLAWVNCVRVTARRSSQRGNPAMLSDGPLLARTANDVAVSATAMIDRDVIGFRQADSRPIPLAPLALLSDPSSENDLSWEHQVERRAGGDGWCYNRSRRMCEPTAAGDGICEMHVRLGCGPQQSSDAGGSSSTGRSRTNACLLQIGVADLRGLCQQLRAGVVREQLADFGHRFALGADNTLLVPGSPQGPQAGSAELALLQRALEEIRLVGEPRIWPLFSGFDEATGAPVITSFVAARVAEVGELDGAGNLRLVLQPCVLVLPGVLTDASRRGVGGISVLNRYLCKVRLVE